MTSPVAGTYQYLPSLRRRIERKFRAISLWGEVSSIDDDKNSAWTASARARMRVLARASSGAQGRTRTGTTHFGVGGF
jgi:hypothetical protein